MVIYMYSSTVLYCHMIRCRYDIWLAELIHDTGLTRVSRYMSRVSHSLSNFYLTLGLLPPGLQSWSITGIPISKETRTSSLSAGSPHSLIPTAIMEELSHTGTIMENKWHHLNKSRIQHHLAFLTSWLTKVTHLSTDQTQPCLTSVIWWELMFQGG